MAPEEFKRKLNPILSADVKSYSPLMRDDEDETIRIITAYRSAIEKLVESKPKASARVQSLHQGRDSCNA